MLFSLESYFAYLIFQQWLSQDSRIWGDIHRHTKLGAHRPQKTSSSQAPGYSNVFRSFPYYPPIYSTALARIPLQIPARIKGGGGTPESPSPRDSANVFKVLIIYLRSIFISRDNDKHIIITGYKYIYIYIYWSI